VGRGSGEYLHVHANLRLLCLALSTHSFAPYTPKKLRGTLVLLDRPPSVTRLYSCSSLGGRTTVYPRLTHTYRKCPVKSTNDRNTGSTIAFASDSSEIALTSLHQARHPDLSSTVTELTLGGDMTLWHYYFDAWPDHGVPKGMQVEALRSLVKEVSRRREAELCEVWIHW
jgi:hypothetical protein